MLYLDSLPPAHQPIEIRDIGGLVSDYKKQTERFSSQGREVRLVYCRSACTMALSLSNACVYPDSKLFFHMAYDPRTKERNSKESEQLFAMYPAKVQARLGRLTPDNKMLSGTELISLGVPECGRGQTQIAKNDAKPKAVAASPTRPAASPLDPAAIVEKVKQVASAIIGPVLSLLR